MVFTHFHDADLVVEDADLTAHAGQADPHTVYQKESEKAAASGYASLDSGTKVPIAQIPTGTSSVTVALGDAAAGLITTHEGAANPHPTYETAAEALAQIGTHAGLADPHTGYVREADANWVDLTDSGATTLHSHTGGAPPSGTTVEKDLGSTPVFQGKFTITDAGISTSSKVLCWQAPGPYTGKGTRADEAQMQPVNVTAVEPLSGSATVYWETPAMLTSTIPVGTVGSNNERASTGLSQLADHPAGRGSALRLGKVKGNVKFSYVIFA